MIPVYYVRVKFGVNVLHLVLLAGSVNIIDRSTPIICGEDSGNFE